MFLYHCFYHFSNWLTRIATVVILEYSRPLKMLDNTFWPGRYKCFVYLIEDCIECQTNKSKRHDLHEAPLEKWGELETTPFKTIHIDHKSPLRPSSNSNNHCLVVVDAFSRLIGVYPVKVTSAPATIYALEKRITSYGIPQKIIHDNGTAFINSDFINWTKEFGVTLAPRTTYSMDKRKSRSTKSAPYTILENLH